MKDIAFFGGVALLFIVIIHNKTNVLRWLGMLCMFAGFIYYLFG
jgi:1,4-dihydroxy-2-naphthoate octaprenyltransferase